MAIKLQKGKCIPRSVQEAYDIDKRNNNTVWQDAIKKEVDILTKVYPTFEIPDNPSDITSEHNLVNSEWSFTFDRNEECSARLLGKYRYNNDINYNSCSGIINFEDMELALQNALLLNLNIVLCTVDPKYNKPPDHTKLYTVLGNEFGPLAGQKVLIKRALYNEKVKGSTCHNKLAHSLNAMEFKPMNTRFNYWAKSMDDGNDQHIIMIADDILILSKSPYDIVSSLRETYSYNLQEVHEGGHLICKDLTYDDENKCWEWGEYNYEDDNHTEEQKRDDLMNYHQFRMDLIKAEYSKKDPILDVNNTSDFHRLFANLNYFNVKCNDDQSPRQSTVYGEYWK